MLYMIEQPAILDSAGTRRLLGVEATPIEKVIAEIVETGGAVATPTTPGERTLSGGP